MSATFWLSTCAAATPATVGSTAWTCLAAVLVVGTWTWLVQSAFLVICGTDALDETSETWGPA